MDHYSSFPSVLSAVHSEPFFFPSSHSSFSKIQNTPMIETFLGQKSKLNMRSEFTNNLLFPESPSHPVSDGTSPSLVPSWNTLLAVAWHWYGKSPSLAGPLGFLCQLLFSLAFLRFLCLYPFSCRLQHFLNHHVYRRGSQIHSQKGSRSPYFQGPLDILYMDIIATDSTMLKAGSYTTLQTGSFYFYLCSWFQNSPHWLA